MYDNDVKVEILADYNRAALEQEWRTLEHHAHGSVFQSWAWIHCWLTSLPPEVHPLLVRVCRRAAVVALGMVCRAKVRCKFGKARALLLNETGATNLDCVTIEHNGLLCVPGEANVIEQVAHALQQRDDWDEWVLSGIDRSVAAECYENLAAPMGWTIHESGDKPWYFVDLAQIRARDQDYLERLSVNTRYQVRRALKEYASRGEVKIELARSVDEALAFFERLKFFHQRYWQARGRPGAFGHEFFEVFHRHFIEQGWSQGGAQLSRVYAGDHEIGYLYNLAHEHTVYSYQSGFNYENDAKIKPGLVSHALAVQRAICDGYDCYDFLAGDGQYKRSLASHSETMRWICLRRPRMAFRMEAFARRVRDRSRQRLDAVFNRAQLRSARH